MVGASLAGHASARALRDLGFTGRITIVGGEEHRPYDRPPLSKDFLAGTAVASDLWLEGENEDLDADWRLGAMAASLDPATRTVMLADGRTVTSDAVVISTGSFAKTFPQLPAGVHTLRTLDDAIGLRAELTPGTRLVVVGSGFIGLEVAATARGLGVDVTVLGTTGNPLSRAFGTAVGEAVQGIQERHGVRIRNNTRVEAVLGQGGTGGRVTGVRLISGEIIDADVVVLGIGSIAATDWLEDSGIELGSGVVCSEVGETSAPGIFAVGDCSAWFDPVRGTHHRIEHWSDSRDRPAIAMAALLSIDAPAKALRPSYLWSDQAGSRIQFAGRLLGGETVDVEAGTAEGGDLLVVYRRGDEPVAVVGINQPKLVAAWRKRLTAPAIARPAIARSATSASEPSEPAVSIA
ncbi:MAG: FAD-dependent oxidoreductase [Burkholderiaceae bacterium]|nr:FAD-dependent oxidoreductase [Microbacteriaceae bacterium]